MFKSPVQSILAAKSSYFKKTLSGKINKSNIVISSETKCFHFLLLKYTFFPSKTILFHLKKFSFIVVIGGDTLCHLHRFLQGIKYVIHEFFVCLK
jgi:hypothetical protein